MSSAPETVGQHELAFFFGTNEPVPVRPLLNFLYEVERIARTQRHLGPSALVEIVEVTTGTKLVRITFDRKVTLGSLVVAVIALGNDLSSRIQQPAGRLAESVAEMCLDHGVAECIITTPEAQIRFTRDQLPAIATVQDKRNRDQERIPLFNARFSDSRGYAQAEPAALITDQEERLLQRPNYDGLRRVDGRVYTIVGKLQPPGSVGQSVPQQEWQFNTQSGKTYIARGVNPDRARVRSNATVVIRAETIGSSAGYTVLSVKDVFNPEEP